MWKPVKAFGELLVQTSAWLDNGISTVTTAQ